MRFWNHKKLLKTENYYLAIAVFISFALRCTSQITAAGKRKEAVAAMLELRVPSRSAGKDRQTGRPGRAESWNTAGEGGERGKEDTNKRESLPNFMGKLQVLPGAENPTFSYSHFACCLFLSQNQLSAVTQRTFSLLSLVRWAIPHLLAQPPT